jgi:predicted ABC-type ATPase
VRRIETWLYASISAHQTVGVETVLSTDKYRKLVDHAHEHGFAVRLIYVFLKSADLNVERVRIRVSKGGHDVEESSIRRRRQRSFEQLGWFLGASDRVDIYDNSGAEPSLVFVKQGEDAAVYGPLIAEVARAIEAWQPGLLRTAQARSDEKARGDRPTGKRRRRRRRRGDRRPRGAASSA